MFDNPDPVRTIVAPEMKPVPVNPAIHTLELLPYEGEMAERVGADIVDVSVAERGVVWLFVTEKLLNV